MHHIYIWSLLGIGIFHLFGETSGSGLARCFLTRTALFCQPLDLVLICLVSFGATSRSLPRRMCMLLAIQSDMCDIVARNALRGPLCLKGTAQGDCSTGCRSQTQLVVFVVVVVGVSAGG